MRTGVGDMGRGHEDRVGEVKEEERDYPRSRPEDTDRDEICRMGAEG